MFRSPQGNLKVTVGPQTVTNPETEAQQKLFGAALGAKRAGKGKPSYVPQSVWEMTESQLEKGARGVC
jgi:hypothetical protein